MELTAKIKISSATFATSAILFAGAIAKDHIFTANIESDSNFLKAKQINTIQHKILAAQTSLEFKFDEEGNILANPNEKISKKLLEESRQELNSLSNENTFATFQPDFLKFEKKIVEIKNSLENEKQHFEEEKKAMKELRSEIYASEEFFLKKFEENAKQETQNGIVVAVALATISSISLLAFLYELQDQL